MFTFLPCQAWATTFKVALIGPWTCDLLYSKALPDLAARLATSRINKDPELNKGYWYDYTLINEDCKSSRALARFAELEGYGAAYLGPANPGYCSSAALYAKEWDVGLLSWGCLNPNMKKVGMFPTYLQPLPLPSRVLFAVLRYFRWAHVAIISEETDLWEATGQELAASLRTLGLPVKPVVTMEEGKEGARRALTKVRETDRVRGTLTTRRYNCSGPKETCHPTSLGLLLPHSGGHVHALRPHRRPVSVPSADNSLSHAYDRPWLHLHPLRHAPLLPALQECPLLCSR